jgi:hypothetical protein
VFRRSKPTKSSKNGGDSFWQANCTLQTDERKFPMRASGQLRVLALDVFVAVFPAAAGFGLYFLLRLLAA